MSAVVPLVDFTAFQLGCPPSTNQQQIESLVNQIHSAFSDIGFVYLKNHGISQSLIENSFKKSAEFFSLPRAEKDKYSRPDVLHNHGYCEIGREVLYPSRPADYKEVYDVNPLIAKMWPPDSVVADFQETLQELYTTCRHLSIRVLDVIALGLKLQDSSYFSKRHSLTMPTFTALRTLYYPPIKSAADCVSPVDLILQHSNDLIQDQVRCAEHTDYGSLTVLFQDEAGGLEVFQRDKGFVAAPPIPGTVIVNLGDLMQRWTADQLVSTRHRVVNPPLSTGDADRSRQSIVCFVHPDEDCLVECIDGSHKYPPITAKNYLAKRFTETFVA